MQDLFALCRGLKEPGGFAHAKTAAEHTYMWVTFHCIFVCMGLASVRGCDYNHGVLGVLGTY